MIDGPRAYLAVRERDAEVQEVDLGLSINFPDLNGDGVLTLGCAGDSNTSLQAGRTRWCERLEELVGDPNFRTVNVAVPGATAIPSHNSAYQQIPVLLDPVYAVDAVMLSFGTNDTNLVYFDPDPARFDGQLDEIVSHLELHYSTLESLGMRVYVATMPPRRLMVFGAPGRNERIIGLNARIRAAFSEAEIVDHYDLFYSDTTEMADGIHLNQLGQNKRAWRALEALIR